MADLPVFGSLIGNDYISREDLKSCESLCTRKVIAAPLTPVFILTVHDRLGVIRSGDVIPSVADFCRWKELRTRRSLFGGIADPEIREELWNLFEESIREYRIPDDGMPPAHVVIQAAFANLLPLAHAGVFKVVGIDSHFCS